MALTRTLRLHRSQSLAVMALMVLGGIAVWQLSLASEIAPTAAHSTVVGSGTLPAFADLVEQVSPAVVNVSVEKSADPISPAGGSGAMPFGFEGGGFEGGRMDEFLHRFFQQRGQQQPAPRSNGAGSGFLINAGGHVVTNFHVVEGAENITVRLADGAEHAATVVGTDSKTDLAVLKIEADGPLPFVEFGDSDSARVGDWVVAIGNPFGLSGTTTVGILSARGRDIQSGPYDDYLQIDAPINRGNSGGPVFNTQGKVIGVNTAIFSPNGGNVGIGFAIPSASVQPIVAQLQDHHEVRRGWLGVQIQNVDQDVADSLNLDNAAGALVSEVVAESPADEAGIRTGDILLSFDGRDIDTGKELSRAVAAAGDGDSVRIGVWRDGRTKTIKVNLATAGEQGEQVPEAVASLPATLEAGLALAPLTDDARRNWQIADGVDGALVVQVKPGSAAARKGIRPGDVIARVNRSPATNPHDVEKEFAKANTAEKESVLLLVRRGDGQKFVPLRLALFPPPQSQSEDLSPDRMVRASFYLL
jgi:serine protease Do